ncbi:hypothetical protein F2Q69_00010258 [Brassica cretica]|uniref:RNase H type-1 domain-containing protein n=1 Tax=Brassica cretica TaxID=69181 RepID=A0A8S9QSG5_BRACR|nr:hypothetical protein F2Q69_00010258 [Brassica cretica]
MTPPSIHRRSSAILTPHGATHQRMQDWHGSSRIIPLEELNRGSKIQSAVSSPCMAEALAIREALLHAASQNYPNICIRTDSQVIANAISSRRHTRSSIEFSPISTNSFSLLLRLLFVAVSFSSQEPTMGQQMDLQKLVFQPMLLWA